MSELADRLAAYAQDPQWPTPLKRDLAAAAVLVRRLPSRDMIRRDDCEDEGWQRTVAGEFDPVVDTYQDGDGNVWLMDD